MAKKSATPTEKRYLERVAGLGCIICNAPANVHHIREGQGVGMRASHYLTIPLCREHHQGEFSIHNSRREFQNVYGNELDLLAKTIQMLSS